MAESETSKKPHPQNTRRTEDNKDASPNNQNTKYETELDGEHRMCHIFITICVGTKRDKMTPTITYMIF